jgi:type IX secretion system PorP/SprF family membrane protein
MKKSNLTLFLLIFVGVTTAVSQELSYGYYNYIMNRFNLNPAFAGNNGNISALLNTKTYQSGFTDAPRNTMFGVHAPVNREQGLGGRIVADNRGAYELTKYDLTYSYQIQIDESSDLRFGLSAGALRRMLNPNKIRMAELLEQNDPTLAADYYDETNFIAGVGLVYDYENFQFGLSAPGLIIGGEELSEHIVGTASYLYQIANSDFAIHPTFIYQNMPVIDNRYDILLKGEFKEKVWAQVGFQSTQNLNFGLGFDLGPFGIGYNYEMNNSELSNIASGSNEIIVRVSFLPAKTQRRNELMETLDAYVAKFNTMLNDQNDNYSRNEVMNEISNIRMELAKLNKVNDKKTAKAVEKKLDVIEGQIIELENKYQK